MAAGGPGDHPLMDIINYNLEAYNKRFDELISEISKFVSSDRLSEMFDWNEHISISKEQLKEFEITLEKKLSELKEQAIENGWEISAILPIRPNFTL